MRSISKKNTSAFTLIELLVVIAIIAVLMGIAIPVLIKAKTLAIRFKCANSLKQINYAVGLYLNANDDKYPSAQDPMDPRLYRIDPNACIWLWMGRGWRPLIEPYLNFERGPKNAPILLCPSDKISSNAYQSTSYSYSMAFYHSAKQINDINIVSKTYGTVSPPAIPQRTSDVAKPSQKILIGEWFSNHERTKVKDTGWWVWAGSRNYIFADGHTAFIKAKKILKANDGNPNPNLTANGIKGIDYIP